MKSLLVFVPLLVALLAGGDAHARGAAAQTAPSAAATLAGTWGGDRISVAATSGSVRIQVDCVVATADDAINLDGKGAFTARLTFVPVRGAALDGAEQRPVSTVKGRVEKGVLHLTITPEGSEAAGTFTLRVDTKAKLPNCRLRS